MKDLGPLLYFLGLGMHSSLVETYLYPHKYIEELINLTQLQDGRYTNTLLEVECEILQGGE